MGELDGEYYRRDAIYALSNLASSDADVRERIIRHIEHPEEDTRQAVVYALGASAASVGQAIVGSLQDKSADVREAAARVLITLTEDMELQHEALRQALTDVSGYVRCAGLNSLPASALNDATVRALLLGRLDDPDATVRRTAIRTMSPLVATDQGVHDLVLAKTGAEEGWLDRLEAGALFVRDADPQVRRAAISIAAQALDQPPLPPNYHEGEARAVKARTVRVLTDADPADLDDEILARLTRLLQDDWYDVQEAAYSALLRLAVTPEADLEAPDAA